MSLLIAFGSAVRAKREQKGLSQEALADVADLDRTYISGIERGVRNPTLKIIGILADSLGVDIKDFFSGAPMNHTRQGETRAI